MGPLNGIRARRAILRLYDDVTRLFLVGYDFHINMQRSFQSRLTSNPTQKRTGRITVSAVVFLAET